MSVRSGGFGPLPVLVPLVGLGLLRGEFLELRQALFLQIDLEDVLDGRSRARRVEAPR